MRPTRLILTIVLVAFCAGQALAQSPANHGFSVIAPQKNQNNFSEASGADQFVLRMFPEIGFDGQNSPTDDPIKEQSTSRKDLVKLLDAEQNRPHTRSLEWQPDVACYSIRSYRVVRDSPDSDTTHRDGYTTCVPSARFRIYTAVEHGR